MIELLTPGSFDKGGISRYTRYEISALRDVYGKENVRVYSLLGPSDDDLETPFTVDWWSGGVGLSHKLPFVAKTTAETFRFRPRIVIAAHVNLSGLGRSQAKAVGAKSVVNVYGREIWSGLRRDAAWGMRSADLVISDCYFTRDYIRRERLRPQRGHMEVLWDCVDTDRFSPAAPDPGVLDRYRIPDPDKYVNVLTLGRMSSEAAHKGYDRLLEAFVMAASRSSELRLIYAGSGDLVPSLRQRAEAAGVAGRVTFIGSVSEADLVDVYRSCHVLSLVSDRAFGRGEGLPLTPLEAAACGKPIIVGNQDGSAEAVVEGSNGFVLDPFDLKTHGERILRLADDPTLRRTMGEAGRARILEFHDYRIFRDRLATMLNGLLA
jgi:phosphatidylinositol alpha-1,6-mannosyltransferase